MHSDKASNDVVKPSCPEEGQWSTGLFDCCQDRSNCIKTFFCPCVTAGQIIEIIDRGNTSSGTACGIFAALHTVHCTWLYASNYRRKLRELFKLPESPYGDQMAHCWCCPCALSQEYRELNNRGAQPSLGWEGNVEKWRREGVMLPPLFPSDMPR